MLCLAVISVQWFFWGYSLAFSDSAGSFYGDLSHFGMMGVLEQPVPGANNKVPRCVCSSACWPTHTVCSIVYSMYQLTFAALVPAMWACRSLK
jgi:Amt family ammonium transporter